MSTSFDSSYGSIGSDNEHAKSTERPGCLVPLARHPKSLKTIGKHGTFSRSLPAPDQGELSESSQSSSSIRNLTFKVRDVAEFNKTSAPVSEIVSELNVKPGKHSTNVGSSFQGVESINRSTEARSQNSTSVCNADASLQIAVSCPSDLSQTHTGGCKECPSHSVSSVMPYTLQETTQPLNIPRSRVSYAGCSSSTPTHAVHYNNKETPGGLNCSSSHIPPRRSESFGELRQGRVVSLVTNPLTDSTQQREMTGVGSDSSPPKYSNMFQDYLHNKQKLNYNPKSSNNSSSSTKGFFNRIFRSRSEAVLNEDSWWLGSAPSTPLEAILSPVLTRSLFRRSRSESVLNQTVDNPELKKYRLDDSECVDVTDQVMTTKPIYTHSISLDSKISTANDDVIPKTTTKPFYSFFGGTGATSLGLALKKRMKRRKCHSVSTDDTCQPSSSSRFFLEKKLPGQEAEIRETKHLTLERNPADKETYFPSAPKTVKINEPRRIYKVNEPKATPRSISILGRAHGREDNVHKDKFTGTFGVVSNTHEVTNSKDVPLVMTWMEDSSGKSSNNILHNFSNYFPPQKKKVPWFAKFQISKPDRCKEETQSNRLDDSFCSSVFSHSSEGSTNSGHDSFSGMSNTNGHLLNPDYLGVPLSVNHSPVSRSPESPFSPVGQTLADFNSQFVMSEHDSDSLSETVSLLVKYKGRPEVQKRVAEKLNTIIKDLEREMNLTPPDSPQHSCHVNTSSIPLSRPGRLYLERHRLCRRNSAPMLSPIEEVRGITDTTTTTMTTTGGETTVMGEQHGDRDTIVGIQRRSDTVPPPIPSSSSPPSGNAHQDRKPTLSKSRSFDEATVDFGRELDACHHSLGNMLKVSSSATRHGGEVNDAHAHSLGNVAKESYVCGKSGNIACGKVGNVAAESHALGKYDSCNESLGNSFNVPLSSDPGNVTDSFFTSPSPPLLGQNSPLPSLSSQNGEVQPRSLVHPAPTTFCDQYGNEHEIAYV
ncbi:hypothetical protein Pmani_016913 [Petrolisthes manimaculis]|uniref:Uncharacterized protein n=1 Tax=Petrolisthes manimaculis TaxID=1843537 RepID=A0AAE1PNA0_9EUCA|nr:hypothetical protein Pmani_016913 [Petrolisthes manimaculis]